MKKTMTKAVTITATATMLISTIPFTATGVLAGEKYPAIATYNELDTTQTSIYDELEALSSEDNTATQDLEVVTPDAPELDTADTQMSGKWGTCDWSIDDDGVLTISEGVGASTEVIKYDNGFIKSASAPWYENSNKIKKINIKGKITFQEKTKLQGLFCGLYNLKEINGLENLYTSNVTDMSYMFSDCGSLTTLDVSNFDTSDITDMSYMFDGCYRVTALDVSNFNTSNVTDMNYMFSGCNSLTILDVSKFNTSNVTDTSHMFSGCGSLTELNVSSFNTENVTNMGDV